MVNAEERRVTMPLMSEKELTDMPINALRRLSVSSGVPAKGKKVDLVAKVSLVSNELIVLQLLHVVQSEDDVNLTCTPQATQTPNR